MDLPHTISIFPLPNVVLFPGVSLPLHIFEPRYRAMVRDAMEGDRLIGMVLLRSQGPRDDSDSPAVYPVGCVGRIERFEPLEDGRSNLLLRGECRFEIVAEESGRPYRRARVSWPREPAFPEEVPPSLRAKLRACVLGLLERAGKERPEAVWDSLPEPWERRVNLLAFGLPLAEVEKMALLECDDCAGRTRRMIEILEFRIAEYDSRAMGGGGRVPRH